MKKILLLSVLLLVTLTGCTAFSSDKVDMGEFIYQSLEEIYFDYDIPRYITASFAFSEKKDLEKLDFEITKARNLEDVKFELNFGEDNVLSGGQYYRGYYLYYIAVKISGVNENVNSFGIEQINLKYEENTYEYNINMNVSVIKDDENSHISALGEPLNSNKPEDPSKAQEVGFGYYLKEDIKINNISYISSFNTVDKIYVNNVDFDEVKGRQFFKDESISIKVVLKNVDYIKDYTRLKIHYSANNVDYKYYSNFVVNRGNYGGNVVVEMIDNYEK